jgi:hypothetical protein
MPTTGPFQPSTGRRGSTNQNAGVDHAGQLPLGVTGAFSSQSKVPESGNRMTVPRIAEHRVSGDAEQ